MDYNIKKDCYWLKISSRGRKSCGVLNCLKCKLNGTCSFYETEPEYEARQERFLERENKIVISSGFILFRERIGF